MASLTSGQLTSPLMASVVHSARDPMEWRNCPHTEAAASSIVSVTLRVAALTCYELELPFQGYPYKLMDLLRPVRPTVQQDAEWQESVAVFLSAPPCCLDSFSLAFRRRFSTPEQLEAQRCQQLLHCLCLQLDCTTYTTERLHSTNARRVQARRSTRSLSLAQAAAFQTEGVPLACRHFKKLQSQATAPAPSRKRKLHDEDESKERPKRRGAGGAWRAFIHTNGQGIGRTDFADLAGQYWALSDEEYQHFAQLGKQATALSRSYANTRAFPLTHRAAMVKVQPRIPGPTLQTVLAGQSRSSRSSPDRKIPPKFQSCPFCCVCKIPEQSDTNVIFVILPSAQVAMK